MNVQFPGLGLDIFVDRVAFSIGDFPVYWYGIIIGLGLALAMVWAFYKSKSFGIDADKLIDVVLISAILGVVGARIYYVIFAAKGEFSTFGEMLDLRRGGLAFYGALIGGLGSAVFLCRFKKIKPLPVADMVSIGFLIGQGIGRWGNFFNQEAFGVNTKLPWGMISGETQNFLKSRAAELALKGIIVDPSLPVHPTFLYESLLCLLGFVLLSIYIKKRKFDGEIFLMYIAWNGLGRAIIEGLRTDSLYLGPIRVSQALAILGAVAAISAIVLFRRKIAKSGNEYYLRPYAQTYAWQQEYKAIVARRETAKSKGAADIPQVQPVQPQVRPRVIAKTTVEEPTIEQPVQFEKSSPEKTIFKAEESEFKKTGEREEPKQLEDKQPEDKQPEDKQPDIMFEFEEQPIQEEKTPEKTVFKAEKEDPVKTYKEEEPKQPEEKQPEEKQPEEKQPEEKQPEIVFEFEEEQKPIQEEQQPEKTIFKVEIKEESGTTDEEQQPALEDRPPGKTIFKAEEETTVKTYEETQSAWEDRPSGKTIFKAEEETVVKSDEKQQPEQEESPAIKTIFKVEEETPVKTYEEQQPAWPQPPPQKQSEMERYAAEQYSESFPEPQPASETNGWQSPGYNNVAAELSGESAAPDTAETTSVSYDAFEDTETQATETASVSYDAFEDAEPRAEETANVSYSAFEDNEPQAEERAEQHDEPVPEQQPEPTPEPDAEYEPQRDTSSHYSMAGFEDDEDTSDWPGSSYNEKSYLEDAKAGETTSHTPGATDEKNIDQTNEDITGEKYF